MTQVIVNGPGSVEWKGKLYLPGDAVDLPKPDADRLIGKGKARPGPERQKVEEAPEKTEAGGRKSVKHSDLASGKQAGEQK